MKLLAIGRPRARVVLVLESSARRDAEAALATLPLAAVGGLIDFQLIELHPFAAFEVLFAGPPRA